MPTGSIDLSLIIQQAFSIIPDHTADVIGQIKGKDLEDWNFQQKGVIVSMPVLSGNDIETHLAFFSTDLQCLLLHIAHCVWGIGAMKGCKLFGKYDLIEIFDRWSINRYRPNRLFSVSRQYYQRVLFHPAYKSRPTPIHELAYFNRLSFWHRQSKSLDTAFVSLYQESDFIQTITHSSGLHLPESVASAMSVLFEQYLERKMSINYLNINKNIALKALNIDLLEQFIDAARQYYGLPLR